MPPGFKSPTPIPPCLRETVRAGHGTVDRYDANGAQIGPLSDGTACRSESVGRKMIGATGPRAHD